MNLLEETMTALGDHGYTTADVSYVGSEDGRLRLPWEQAVHVLDVEYSNDYGHNKIALDLCVRFTDGATLIRMEYDGCEWWRLIPAPAAHGSPFTTVTVHAGHDMLADLNATDARTGPVAPTSGADVFADMGL